MLRCAVLSSCLCPTTAVLLQGITHAYCKLNCYHCLLKAINVSVAQLENGYPTPLRNLDCPDQYDIARSDVVVPNKVSLIAIKVLTLRILENGTDISFLENFSGARSELPP